MFEGRAPKSKTFSAGAATASRALEHHFHAALVFEPARLGIDADFPAVPVFELRRMPSARDRRPPWPGQFLSATGVPEDGGIVARLLGEELGYLGAEGLVVGIVLQFGDRVGHQHEGFVAVEGDLEILQRLRLFSQRGVG